MSVIILHLTFLAIFLNLLISRGQSGLKTVIVETALIISAVLLIITEVSGYFKVLNFEFVLLSWIIFLMLCCIRLYVKRNQFAVSLNNLRKQLTAVFTGFKNATVLLLFTGILLILLLFIQGLIYPPNNWDSMTYHMARITHWLSWQSVDYYPTHIVRQLYQPPFAEYVIMHFSLLSGTDYFANSVQLLYLLFTCISIAFLAEAFGLGRRWQGLSVVLALTIPEVMLQASSTQNDIVVSFFIIATLHFSVKAYHDNRIVSYAFAGIASALAVLTKGVAAIYLAPILALFGLAVIVRMIQNNSFVLIRYLVVMLLVFMVATSFYFLRNYNFNQTLLGVDKEEARRFSNNDLTPATFFSSVIKNAGLHMGPYPVNRYTDQLIIKMHKLAGLDINQPGSNFGNTVYKGGPDLPTHEDTASNTIPFIVILISIVVVIIQLFRGKKINSVTALYLFLLLLQGILFCALLKWQPWHTRLHTPLFLLSVPFVCRVFYMFPFRKYATLLLLTLLIVPGVWIVLHNRSRPLVSTPTSAVKSTDPRFRKYFANQMEAFEEYKNVHDQMRLPDIKKTALLLSGDHWEYPLFNDVFKREILVSHIYVTNVSGRLPLLFNDPDCIVSTTFHDREIVYEGATFYNSTPNNKILWLYLKSSR